MPAPTPPDAPVAVPPVPDRTDKSTFVTRSFNFTSWFAPFQSWLVTVLTYITTSNTWVESQARAAASSAAYAADSADAAEASAVKSAASAASATMSPGTSATSITSLAIGYGSKSFTLAQTGKSFVVGQFVTMASASDPANRWMNGAITAFNSGTGAITVNVTMIGGSGTYADWTITQSAPMVDSLYEIGDMVTETERGNTFTRANKKFLRSGTILPAASYPEAAADTGLMINGLASTLPRNIALTSMPATDGAGNWVACYGDATNVLISTNNGQTWTDRAHNNTNPVMDCEWIAGASRFVTFGNSNTSITMSYATAALSTFTSGGSITPGTVPAVNTVRSATDGTIALCAWASSSGSHSVVATTTNGTSLTSQAYGATFSNNTPVMVACCVGLGAARWMVGQVLSGSARISTATDASAFASSGNANLTSICGLSGGSNFFLMVSSSGQYNKYSGGSWGTVKTLPGILSSSSTMTDMFAPGGTISATCANWLFYDGTRIITGTSSASNGANAAQGLFAYTTDGEEWITRQLTFPSAAVSSAQLSVFAGNGYLCALPTGVSNQVGAQYSQNWLTAPDYVGKARPVYDNNSAGGSSPRVAYTMIQRV